MIAWPYRWSGCPSCKEAAPPGYSTPHEQTALERQIEATDRQICALIRELYGLTEDEIAIVYGGSERMNRVPFLPFTYAAR
jgi:hypothetical protein